jgi:hypothetical protein
MLAGDRAKYYAPVFGIAFATMLMAQQMSIFCGARSGLPWVNGRSTELGVESAMWSSSMMSAPHSPSPNLHECAVR